MADGTEDLVLDTIWKKQFVAETDHLRLRPTCIGQEPEIKAVARALLFFKLGFTDLWNVLAFSGQVSLECKKLANKTSRDAFSAAAWYDYHAL